MEHGSIGVEEENWLLKETEETIRSEDSLAQKEASIQRLKVNL